MSKKTSGKVRRVLARRERRKKKRGVPYEQALAEVVSALDPNATVRQGQWIDGPDGRRELDVLVEAVVDGIPRRVLIECKDYNRQTTGPIGIAIVDALESKRRDVDAHASFICSNAGFTADAIRKAQRVGIGLIGVMRQNDNRVRFAVVDEIFIRRVKAHGSTWKLRLAAAPVGDLQPSTIAYDGIPIENWINRRISQFVGTSPIVSGTYSLSHTFQTAVVCQSPIGPVTVKGIDISAKVSGGWFAQEVTLDATGALYDWVRRRVRFVPGPGSFLLRNVDLDRGKLASRPPDSEIHRSLQDGEAQVNLSVLDEFPSIEPYPPLDDLLVPADRSLTLPDVLPEMYTSSIEA